MAGDQAKDWGLGNTTTGFILDELTLTFHSLISKFINFDLEVYCLISGYIFTSGVLFKIWAIFGPIV